jgi:hypothetical protein
VAILRANAFSLPSQLYSITLPVFWYATKIYKLNTRQQ